MPPKEINPREVISSEGSDRAKDRPASPGGTWSAERDATRIQDTTSKFGKALELLKDCENVTRVISKLDEAASAGKDHFQEYLLANKDQLQKMRTGLEKDKPSMLEYFDNLVRERSEKDPSWEPLLKLAERRDIGGESTVSEGREDVDALLASFEASTKKGDISKEFPQVKDHLKTVLIEQRENDPEAFNYLEHELQKKFSKDPSWEPLVKLAEEAKLEADLTSHRPESITPTQLDYPSVSTETAEPVISSSEPTHEQKAVFISGMIDDMKRNYSPENREDIKAHLMTTRRNPEAFEIAKRKLQASSDGSWEPIKDLVKEVNRDYADKILDSIARVNTSAGFSRENGFEITDTLLALRKADPEGFEHLDRKIQVLARNESWRRIQNLVRLIKEIPDDHGIFV